MPLVETPVPFPSLVLTALGESRRTLLDLFGAALEAVSGQGAVARRLAGWEVGAPVVLLAVGKAAQAMTAGARTVLGERLARGLVVSKVGHLDSSLLTAWGLEGLEAGHPLPTAGSLLAGRRALGVLDGLKSDEGLLVLISGGASSLLEVPAADLGLADLVRVNEWLLGSGLPIAEVNGVRKSLSAIKGGGLLRWLQGRAARVLAISDVPGDNPSAIGSGLLVPEPDLGARLAPLRLPAWLREKVAVGLQERGALPPVGPRIEIVANLDLAKQAVAEAAQARGLPVYLHRGLLEGEAADRGRELARALLAGNAGLHVWGGETTVRLPPHPGRGGRNQQLALAAAMVLAGHEGVCLLSAGTDGSDGPTDDAGALIDGGTLARARAAGLDAQAALRAADAGTLLAATADLVRTGPTGTNVMDLVLGYCFAPRR
jgi:glycerate 2-kinase